MEEHGIKLSFLMNLTTDDTRPLDWDSLRGTINHYAINGYSIDILREIGSGVAAIAAVSSTQQDKEDEAIIYDNVLAELLHTPFHWGGRLPDDSDEIFQTRAGKLCLFDLFKAHLHDDEALPLDRYNDPLLDLISDEDYRLYGATGVDDALADKVALVLDSGRTDGVTEEVCLSLTRLEARIALTYVGDGDNRANADRVVEKVRQAGGTAMALEGVPYRSVTYTDKEGEVDSYMGDLIAQALKAFDAHKLQVIGMCSLPTAPRSPSTQLIPN